MTQYAGLNLPTEAGSYVLILQNSQDQKCLVGRLGILSFEPGEYAYVGSAMGGLKRRLARYLREIQHPHWHIDALIPVFCLTSIWVFPSAMRQECQVAGILSRAPGVVAVPGFGCTDCRCPSHLFRLNRIEKAPLFETIKGALSCREALILPIPAAP